MALSYWPFNRNKKIEMFRTKLKERLHFLSDGYDCGNKTNVYRNESEPVGKFFRQPIQNSWRRVHAYISQNKVSKNILCFQYFALGCFLVQHFYFGFSYCTKKFKNICLFHSKSVTLVEIHTSALSVSVCLM